MCMFSVAQRGLSTWTVRINDFGSQRPNSCCARSSKTTLGQSTDCSAFVGAVAVVATVAVCVPMREDNLYYSHARHAQEKKHGHQCLLWRPAVRGLRYFSAQPTQI
jgi:hypothetical protein